MSGIANVLGEQKPVEQITAIIGGQIAPVTEAPLLTSSNTPWSGFLLQENRGDLIPSDKIWAWHRTHVCLVTRGNTSFSVNIGGRQERVALHQGSVAVFPSGFGEVHFVYDGSKFQVLVVEIAPERTRVSNKPLPHVALKPQMGISDANVARILTCMKDEVACGSPSGSLFSQSLSLSLTTYLEGRCALSPRRSKIPGRFSASQSQVLRDYVRDNLNSGLNLNELANLFGISSRTFSRMFVRTFGITPHRFVLIQRMDHAKALLMSETAIEEVARAIGLSPTHFSTAFQKEFGMPPKQFRLEHKSCIRSAPFTSDRRQ